MWRFFLLSLVVLVVSNVSAGELKIKPDSPKNYVVVKGDTLWDISSKYLHSPWRWPELWERNKQIGDPHWIYPGDVLTLIMVDGKPKLVVKRLKPTLSMTRHGRKSRKTNPIPTIALADIQQHLTEQQVVTLNEYSNLPVLIGSERDPLFYKNTDVVFINQALVKGKKYGIYQKGRLFSSPKTNQTLGLELTLIAQGKVTENASISQLVLTNVKAEVNNGSVLMPLREGDLPVYFLPKAAPSNVVSSIIGSSKLFTESGKHSVVVIDGGTEQGITQGSVFSVYKPGKIQFVDSSGEVRDPDNYRSYDRIKAYFVDYTTQKLPDVYRGKVMVFRSFENLSYALIIDIKRPVRLGDELINP
jgi:hypothetical protein